MGREMDTTLFVQNGPSMAGLGSGGEGYLSFSIATPTGEGVTTPLTFTRQRRPRRPGRAMRVLCSVLGDSLIARGTLRSVPQVQADYVGACPSNMVKPNANRSRRRSASRRR